MKRGVEKVTREEIARASADFYAAQKTTQNVQQPSQAKPTTDKRSYVARLRTKDMEQFFSKFGDVQELYRYNNKDTNGDTVYVCCDLFEAFFTDFDFAVSILSSENVNDAFDMKALVDYCNTTDLPVEQAIADMIAFDLFGAQFPSYNEELEKHRNKKTSNAFEKLPKSVRSAMRTVHEKQLAENANVGNKGKFGNFNAESHLKSTYGENN